MTVLFGMIGVVTLWRSAQRPFVVMVFAVFGLWLVAGCLHKYPYGASCRLAQHVAAFYCLLAGLGVAVLVERWSLPTRRWRATLAIAGVLGAIGIGGSIRDYYRPYRHLEDVWRRSVVDDLASRSGEDTILVLQPSNGVNEIFAWQLGRRGDRVLWAEEIDWASVGRTRSSLWMMTAELAHDERPKLTAQLAASGKRWRCVERTTSVLCPDLLGDPIQHVRVYHWVREGE